MSSCFDSPGRIKCGTIVTPAFADSLAEYCDLLDFIVVERGVVAADLAASWGAPASAGAATALLTSATGSPGYVRLVHGAEVPGFVPLRTYGWAAYEFTVADCFALHDRISDAGGFGVIGPPQLVPGFDTFIPFQVTGRGGEVLYLNQVLKPEMSNLDLPSAAATVDHIFIAILAAPDRSAAVRCHVAQLGFAEGETWTIPYSVINRSFGLPDETLTAMTMTQVGRMPASEIDQYPAAATSRPTLDRALPPGNAMVSFITESLDDIGLPVIAPPMRHPGPLYAGRRCATVLGAAGERIELIEAA